MFCGGLAATDWITATIQFEINSVNTMLDMPPQHQGERVDSGCFGSIRFDPVRSGLSRFGWIPSRFASHRRKINDRPDEHLNLFPLPIVR